MNFKYNLSDIQMDKLMNVKQILIILFMFLFSFITVSANEHKPLKMPKIQVIPLHDTHSDREYELYIQLPKSYSKNNDLKYPVVYITDAKALFRMVSASTGQLMRNVILVGISYEIGMGRHESRGRDYTPAKIKGWKELTGKANNHLTFIRNDVIKYVENNYRADSDKRTYFGYSLGGLFGAYALLAQPDTFKNYILGSPSINFVEKYMFQLETNIAQKRKVLNTNVFLSVGALEKDYVGPVEKFASKLKSRNYPNLSLKHVVINSADHSEAFPMSAVLGIKWLADLYK